MVRVEASAASAANDPVAASAASAASSDSMGCTDSVAKAMESGQEIPLMVPCWGRKYH